MPTVSIIVPVYNTEKYIHRCLDSILAQTYSDFELILVDDGSTDSSSAICEEYAQKDNRVIVFHQKNRGQAAARNYALDWVFANSESEYISFVDSDDWVHPKYLELMHEAVEQLNINICQCLHIKTDGSKEVPKVERRISCVSVDDAFIHWYCGTIWGKLFKRKCFEIIRFPEGQIYEDIAIWYKMLFAENSIGLVEETLYFYFINPQGTVRVDWTKPRFARIQAWDRIILFLSGYENEDVFRNALMRYCRVAKSHYGEIERSKTVSSLTKRIYKAKIKRRFRRILWKYKPELVYNKTYSFYFAWTFPKLHWLYWFMIGVRKKIKRTLGIHGK